MKGGHLRVFLESMVRDEQVCLEKLRCKIRILTEMLDDGFFGRQKFKGRRFWIIVLDSNVYVYQTVSHARS